VELVFRCIISVINVLVLWTVKLVFCGTRFLMYCFSNYCTRSVDCGTRFSMYYFSNYCNCGTRFSMYYFSNYCTRFVDCGTRFSHENEMLVIKS
jgi:hypothetical protein